uniref:C1q domain-containing protein n=1 Tax=Neogobius melanostomus TaxID=47308 RepID=A0A8C6WEE0_9GOBI
ILLLLLPLLLLLLLHLLLLLLLPLLHLPLLHLLLLLPLPRLSQTTDPAVFVPVSPVAFTASLGENGLQKTTSGNKNLIYKDVLTNVDSLYPETGVFTAPVRGVYYVRFTANAPTDFPMSAVLYRNNQHIELIAHEQPSGSGSDTASNGAALLLERGDTLQMVLWHETQIWDNSNHHSTFSGFLLFPLPRRSPVWSVFTLTLK